MNLECDKSMCVCVCVCVCVCLMCAPCVLYTGASIDRFILYEIYGRQCYRCYIEISVNL